MCAKLEECSNARWPPPPRLTVVCGAVGFDASLTASEWVDEGRYSLDADSKYAGAPSKGRAAKQNKVCASHMLAT